jgi:hypothetical protein
MTATSPHTVPIQPPETPPPKSRKGIKLTGAVAASLVLVAGCGTAGAHVSASRSPSASQVASATPVDTYTPAAVPTCDTSTWDANNIGGMPSNVSTDIGSIQSDIRAQDQTSLSSDGHQLNIDALAALRTGLPPKCAQRLHHDDKMMLFSYAVAGASLFLADLDPAKTTGLDNLAAKDLTAATRYQHKVENACGQC